MKMMSMITAWHITIRKNEIMCRGSRTAIFGSGERYQEEKMASSKEYMEFILEQLSELDDISYRAMMGEYILYYRGKIVGGIYDDRLLVKPTKTAVVMMPNADMELPYEGAKEMLLVDDVDNKEFLRDLLDAMYPELPAPKNRK